MQGEADRAKGARRNSVKIAAPLDPGSRGASRKTGIIRINATDLVCFAFPHQKNTLRHDLPRKKIARFGQNWRIFTCLREYNV
jgi:hypothetical protein